MTDHWNLLRPQTEIIDFPLYDRAPILGRTRIQLFAVPIGGAVPSLCTECGALPNEHHPQCTHFGEPNDERPGPAKTTADTNMVLAGMLPSGMAMRVSNVQFTGSKKQARDGVLELWSLGRLYLQIPLDLVIARGPYLGVSVRPRGFSLERHLLLRAGDRFEVSLHWPKGTPPPGESVGVVLYGETMRDAVA